VLFNTNVDFIGADSSNALSTYLVLPNDYLELFGGGALYSIVYARTVSYNGVNYPALQLNQSASIPQSANGTGSTNWRIIRQPRRVPGEDILTLPQDVVVDIGQIGTTGLNYSQNVPSRGTVTVGTTTVPNYEILFSPSGDVIGQSASTGKILLWVRDATVPSPSQGDTPPMQGNPTLVGIQVRGGFLGTYPVVPNTNAASYPTQFYTDALRGRSGF
jgi:hypothetical protein